MSIDISKLKNRWLGIWNPSVVYKKNDVVQYRNSSYVCIQDIPENYTVASDVGVSTNYYTSPPPTVILKTIDPRDTTYWLDMAPSLSFKSTWQPRQTYNMGDMVELGGDVYVCIQGGVRNTYVRDTAYWTQIFESADRDYRYVCSDFYNQQPLGWTRNLGDAWHGGSTPSWFCGFVGYDGNAYQQGNRYRGSGMGTAANNATGQAAWATTGFSYVDWLISTDNGGTGPLTTPDGQAPKCIQWAFQGGDTTAGSGGFSLWLMNNGEVYSSGRNAQGQMGVGDTTERYWPVRVNNSDTVDWYGNQISKSFNETKIIKVAVSGNGTYNQGAVSCFALGDDGTVWSWGHNDVAQLGLGPESTTTNSVGQARTNQNRPRMIPASYFDHKRIVDIMTVGGSRSFCLAIDEDEYLWGWGVNIRGGLGLADRHADTGYTVGQQFTPVRISVDWRQHGGIQKIMMGSTVGNWEHTYILDGHGYLWFAGEHSNNGTNQIYAGTNSGAVGEPTTKFVRLDKNWFGSHLIENFWLLGGTDHNVLLREKGTGLTYILGGNEEGQLGTSVNHRYNTSSYSVFPTLVKGVRYVKDATNTSTNYVSGGITVLIVTDDGECWGKGTNSVGSLGVGFTGSSYPGVAEIEDNGSQNEWLRIPMPPGEIFTSVHGWGPDNGGDASMFRTGGGGVMIAGSDGTTSHMIQGHLNPRYIGSTYHWQSAHSVVG